MNDRVPEDVPPDDGESDDRKPDVGPTESGKREHFPETQATWIGRKLNEGERGLAEIRRHIMEVYDQPLQIYLRVRLRDWSLGEPADLVSGFFTDRLSRDDYLNRWVDAGDKKLRHWLINGLNFFIKEEIKRLKRDRKIAALPDESAFEASDPTAEEQFEKSYMKSIVATALAAAKKLCEAQELGPHWRVFELHHLDALTFPEIAEAVDLEAERARVMARTAKKRFATSLREVLKRDNVAEENLDSVIRGLGMIGPDDADPDPLSENDDESGPGE